ncbi:MAG: nucleoside triphosphate pyrophosphohydrolase [Spirochaeta sp. LUC14_002_19_P3]|nr:MAG: nucleoside triphosphate pyrophosphohydrolase [Spirochaeta sp. LUC14_002_19_P3]
MQNNFTTNSVNARAAEEFTKLLQTIALLRSPEGCPWDREQSPSSMRECLLEECHELIEAINTRDTANVREEIGDIILITAMISQMYAEEQHFDIAAVLEELNAKLIRRHPHVFGESKARHAEEALQNWERVKTDVEGRKKTLSVLDGIPQSLPPLNRALKLQKKAAKKGFDWPDMNGPLQKIQEELRELTDLVEQDKPASPERREEELGDLLFSIVNYARHLGIDPALALSRSSLKFEQRFRHVEQQMNHNAIPMAPENLAVMDTYWEEAKNRGT